jgi:hypothetical protein
MFLPQRQRDKGLPARQDDFSVYNKMFDRLDEYVRHDIIAI